MSFESAGLPSSFVFTGPARQHNTLVARAVMGADGAVLCMS